MPVDPAFILEMLRGLVRIDSRNPALEYGAPGEGEAARFVASHLRRLGWTSRTQDLGDDRMNVVARRSGTGGGRSLMINVHLDTVGVAGMSDPFGADLRDGRVLGRGAQDVKGGAAAALGLAKAMADGGASLRGDVVLAFVADEEHASRGTERLVEDVRADAAIVLEPTDLDVCVAHRGFGVFRVRTTGRTAHGGESDTGVDANMVMAHALVEIDRVRERWNASNGHPLLGSATLHIPLVSGGRQLFMYAGSCEAHVECRTLPGQTVDAVLAELRSSVRAGIELVQWRDPWEADPASAVVPVLETAVETVRGRPAVRIGHPWWEESALLAGAGIDTVVIGPTGAGLHTEEEWVDVDSVVRLAAILEKTVLAWCS